MELVAKDNNCKTSKVLGSSESRLYFSFCTKHMGI